MGGIPDAGQIARDLDPTNKKGALRQHLRELDPTASTFKPSSVVKTAIPVFALPGTSELVDRTFEAVGLQKSDAQKALEAQEEELKKKRAAIVARPDMTEMVIRANRNLRALNGRSVLSANNSLSTQASVLGR